MFRLPCVVWVSAPCAGWMDWTFRVNFSPISHVSTVSRVITSWVVGKISTFKNHRFPNHRKPYLNNSSDGFWSWPWPPGLEIFQQKSGAKKHGFLGFPTTWSEFDVPRYSEALNREFSSISEALAGGMADGLLGGENCCAWKCWTPKMMVFEVTPFKILAMIGIYTPEN